MPKFTKKPVVVEAEKFTTENVDALVEWMRQNGCSVNYFWSPSEQHLDIATLEGVMTASVGDWIIKGIKGEFYPCKPDIFEDSYEEVKNG